MERVLIVAEIYPFPFNTGGKLRTANIIIQLAKSFTVDLVCFSHDEVTPEQIKMAEEYCDEVYVIKGKKPAFIRKLFNLPTKSPNAEYIVKSPEMIKKISEITGKHKYKAVIAERLYAFQYVRDICGSVPVYVDMHDIEHEAMAYFSRIASSFVQKWHYIVEEKKVRRLEKRVFEKVHRIMTVSESDMNEYVKQFPTLKDRFITVRNGVNIPDAASLTSCERQRHTLLFVGSLRHPPNLHGLKWFVENSWGIIAENYPDAVFEIAGYGEISDKDRELFDNKKGVRFLGFVEDIHPFFRKASCMIVPLFSGSGTRMKILEAFSFGLPVVSTTVGAHGLMYTHGHDILITDDAEKMAEYVSKLFDDTQYAETMAQSGYALASGEYGWDNIGEKLIREINGTEK